MTSTVVLILLSLLSSSFAENDGLFDKVAFAVKTAVPLNSELKSKHNTQVVSALRLEATYVAGYQTTALYASTTCSGTAILAASYYASACTKSGTTYSQTLINLSNLTPISSIFSKFVI